MGVNFSLLAYEPGFNLFARPITFYPYASQPGAAGFQARGIWHTDALNVQMEDGSLFSDQLTNMDILESEFTMLSQQNDRIYIGPDGAVPAEGEFEITSTSSNGGGEMNLILRKWLPPLP